MVLFIKAHVGAYLRGGKMVNLAGYQGRQARAVAAPGQMSLFGGPESGKPLPPSPLQGKDAVAHTPDLFADVDEHGEVPPGYPADAPKHSDRKILFISQNPSEQSNASSSNLINNPPEATNKQELNMTPLTEEQRAKIARGQDAYQAWVKETGKTARAEFKEAARGGRLDHLYQVQMDADAKFLAAEKAKKKSKNDAWREKNLPGLIARKRERALREDMHADAVIAARIENQKLLEQERKVLSQMRRSPEYDQPKVERFSKPGELPRYGVVSEDDPAVYGSWLLGHEGEPWSHVRLLARG